MKKMITMMGLMVVASVLVGCAHQVPCDTAPAAAAPVAHQDLKGDLKGETN